MDAMHPCCEKRSVVSAASCCTSHCWGTTQDKVHNDVSSVYDLLFLLTGIHVMRKLRVPSKGFAIV